MTENQITERLTALYPKLFNLYNEGADLLPEELLRLGETLLDGNYGLPEDKELAYTLIEESAHRGHVLSMVAMMSRSIELNGLKEEALMWMNRAAEQGDVEATFTKGITLISGQGNTPVDMEQGWLLIDKAATNYHPDALFQVGADYIRATGHEKDDVLAKYYELAALNAGSQRASSTINSFFKKEDLVEGKDYIDAERVVNNAVARGCHLAQLEKANSLFMDQMENGAPEPSKEVIDLLTQAAQGGVPTAMCNLAQHYLAKGETEKAHSWLEKGCDAQFPAAKALLGKLLVDSDSPADRERGTHLTLEAVNYNQGIAQQTISLLIEKGLLPDLPEGVRKDFFNTLFWQNVLNEQPEGEEKED